MVAVVIAPAALLLVAIVATSETLSTVSAVVVLVSLASGAGAHSVSARLVAMALQVARDSLRSHPCLQVRSAGSTEEEGRPPCDGALLVAEPGRAAAPRDGLGPLPALSPNGFRSSPADGPLPVWEAGALKPCPLWEG